MSGIAAAERTYVTLTSQTKQASAVSIRAARDCAPFCLWEEIPLHPVNFSSSHHFYGCAPGLGLSLSVAEPCRTVGIASTQGPGVRDREAEQFRYLVFCERFMDDAIQKGAPVLLYGLQCLRRSEDGWHLADMVHGISSRRCMVSEIAAMFNRCQLSALHFRDALEDYLSAL